MASRQDLSIVSQAVDTPALSSSEMSQHITIARHFPRDTALFATKAKDLVCMDEDTAGEMFYVLERGDKPIEGPSIRFAECIEALWGNNRVATRVTGLSDEFVTAQGIFQDLENNRVISAENQRSIMYSDKGKRSGQRFSVDMIAVTANAAASIALRNAITRGIPRPYWVGAYLAAKSIVGGDTRSLAARFEAAVHKFEEIGVDPDTLLKKLRLPSASGATADHMIRLRGMLQAIRDQDTTVGQLFADVRTREKPRTDVGEKLRNGKADQSKVDAPPVEEEAIDVDPQEDEPQFLEDLEDALANAQSLTAVTIVAGDFQAAIEHSDASTKAEAQALIQDAQSRFASKSAASEKL